METWIWAVIAIGVVLALGLALAGLLRRLGREDGHAVHWSDDAGRVRRRQELHLRPIGPAAMRSYAHRWNEIQLAFVELPEGAVKQAERLLDEVIRARGYPDNRDRVALVSVDHPRATTRFREGLRRGAKVDGAATTEDFRGAFVAYRGLFLALLETDPDDLGGDGRDDDNGRDDDGGRDDDETTAGRAREWARAG